MDADYFSVFIVSKFFPLWTDSNFKNKNFHSLLFFLHTRLIFIELQENT